MSLPPGYADSIGRIYDLFNPLLTPPEVDRAQTELVLHFAAPAKEVADIGAGTGRLALKVAAKGIKVHCVEPSQGMLDAMLIKASQKPELLPLLTPIRAPATSFKLSRPVSFIYMCWSFFGLTTDQERLEALRNIHSHLTPDGLFMVDQSFGSDDEDVPLTECGRLQVGELEMRMLREDKTVAPQVLESRLVYETWRGSERIALDEGRFRYGDIRKERFFALLEEAGFTFKHKLSGYKLDAPFIEGKSESLVAILAKR